MTDPEFIPVLGTAPIDAAPAKPLTVDELAGFISIALSADKRHAPVLRGKAAGSRIDIEAHQEAFCRWAAGRILESRQFTILRAPPAWRANYFPGAADNSDLCK